MVYVVITFLHPLGRTKVHAGVLGGRTQFSFNAQQLIVLGRTFASARGAGFDFSRAQAHGQVGNVIVFGFTRTMRRHDAPSVLFGEFDSVNGFRNGSNLIDLEQEAIGRLLFDSFLNLDGVGHGQVVTDNLDLVTNSGSNLGPVLPVLSFVRS